MKRIISILKQIKLVEKFLLFVVLFYTFLPQIHQFSVKEHHCTSCCSIFSFDGIAGINLPTENKHHHHSETCPICTYFNSVFASFTFNYPQINFDLFQYSNKVYIVENNYIKNDLVATYSSRAPPIL